MQKVGIIILFLIVNSANYAEGKNSTIAPHHVLGAELSFSHQLSLTQTPYGFPVNGVVLSIH